MPIQKTPGKDYRPRSPKTGKRGKRPHKPMKAVTARKIADYQSMLKKRKTKPRKPKKPKVRRKPVEHDQGFSTKHRKHLRKVYRHIAKRSRKPTSAYRRHR